jgi:sec-independent protein translocase protein TatB
MLLLVLAVILFGTGAAAGSGPQGRRVVRYVRTMAGSAQEQLSKELGPGFEDLDFRDLNPKAFVQKHLLSDVEPIIADVKSEITDVGSTVKGSQSDVAAPSTGPRTSLPAGHTTRWRRRTPAPRVLTPFDIEAT